MEPSTASIVDTDRLLSVPQVAHFLGIAAKDVYRLTYSGALPTIKVGSRVRIAESALREYLRAATVRR